MARILVFNDEAKTRWIARIWMPGPGQRQSHQERDAFNIEINAMTVINDQLKDRSPVPKIFGYDFDPENPVGSRFVLMEYVRGIIAMDLDGGYQAHGGRIPRQHKHHFYRSFARAHALLASVRVPKIGKLIRQEDGTITVGPLPPYGGPFDTAKDFFKAWAETTIRDLEHGYRKSVMRNRENTRDDVKSTIAFPHALLSVLDRLSASPFNEGPFPIRHPDLLHSNVIADSDYNVLAIIDWEHAKVVPWELLDLPDFFWRVPKALTHHRRDEEAIRDAEEYIAMVAEAEKAENLDSNLSRILGSEPHQDLGYAIRDFWNDWAKARDYLAVLDPFRDPNKQLELGPEPGRDWWSVNGLWWILQDTAGW